jgi:two-component system NtrC family response regulator
MLNPRARKGGAVNTPAILVVEDERLIQWSLRERLEQDGYHVVLADTGEQALDRFQESVGLVLLDLKLPDTNGLALLKRLKKLQPKCQVILMTAYGTPEIAREAMDNGVFQVVDKPFRLDDMALLVDEALCSNGGRGH